MIVSIQDRPELLNELCHEAVLDSKNRAKVNYELNADDGRTLLHAYTHGRFKTGDYVFLVEEDELVAGAGFYEYDQDTAICMSRLYVFPKFRREGKAGIIVEYQLEQLAASHCSRALITFNTYNKGFYDAFVKDIEGYRMKMFPSIWKRFHPIGLQHINNVDQYCCEALI